LVSAVEMRENIGRIDERPRGSMDWEGCDLIEVREGKQGGVPLVKGTRIPADTVVIDHELGSSIEEIHENYPSLPAETIRKLIAFAHAHQL